MPSRLTDISHVSGSIAVTSTAAIFGFFYSWVCSTMWGLDAADPRVAIAAMQAMNASVRNAGILPGVLRHPGPTRRSRCSRVAGAAIRLAARFFLAAGIVYLVGGLVLTLTINVPMNETLAPVRVPETVEDARESGPATPAAGRGGTPYAPCSAG